MDRKQFAGSAFLWGIVAMVATGCASSPDQSGEAEGGGSYTVSGATTSTSAITQYSVIQGDNLWEIAAMSSVYGNAYQWPLIYKANQPMIEDADLIQPGMQLTIGRDYSQAEIEAAEAHARSRGPWVLGEVEMSDRSYLGR